MIHNYIKIAWRNLRRNRGTSLINIFGLALGICCFLLLGTYIINELRYDRFHEKFDRIVYLSFAYKAPTDAEFTEAIVTPTAVVPTFMTQFPEVENGVRLYKSGGEDQSIAVKYEDKVFNESDVLYADPSFFDIFSFEFLEGSAAQSLIKPYAVVITASTAKRYFGDEPALGKSLMISEHAWQVSGVIEDIPPYSQIQFSILGSYQSLPRSKEENWGSANDISYLLLKSPNEHEALQKKIDQFIAVRFVNEISAGYQVRFPVTKLTDVRLQSSGLGGTKAVYIYLLAFMAVSLLLIACINFANLMMAKSVERAHEIGVKKVMGALRKHVLFQFIFESFFTAAISLAIGLIAAIVVMPLFAQYTGIALSIKSWDGGWFVSVFLLLFLLIALVSGGGPAYLLSALKPTDSLKGKVAKSQTGLLLRKGLIVFQFCISMLFIISTIIVGRQIHFMQTTDTGFERSQVIVLDASDMDSRSLLSFKNALVNQGNIAGVTASYDSPVNIQGGYSLSAEEKPGDFSLSVTAIPVEKDFTSVFEMDIVAGEALTDTDVKQVNSNLPNPEYAFLLNETALKSLGWTPEESIGKWVNLNGRRGRVKAIVRDFNFASLHSEIGPVVLFAEYNWFGKLFIKTQSGHNMRETLANVEGLWNTFQKDKLFDYHFLDDEYTALYIKESRTSKILNLFSLATITVSALGLFALSSLAIRQRVKEIGVRKVLGASVLSITRLVSFDFIRLVLLALLIATPIAWLLMNEWLTDFAYRIEVQWWMFAGAGLLAVIVAVLTVGSQAIKAATTNPVDSLRDE